MDHPALFSKNVKLFIVMSIFALIGGYLYVMILSTGYRGLIFIHLSILFFASVAIFLRNIKTFLIFTMLVGLTFYYGFFLTYVPTRLPSPPFSFGIRLEATDVALILCYIHWGFSLASNRGTIRPMILGGKVGALFLAWVIFIFVSGVISSTRLDYSVYEGIVHAKGFLLYFYLINNIRDEYELKIVIYALCVACVIQSSFMIFQFIMKKNYLLQGQYEIFVGPEGFRSVGFLNTPDASAIFLSNIFPIFMIGLFLVNNVAKKFLIGFSIFLILFAVMASQTRITAAVFGAGLVTSFLISYRRKWLSKGQVLLATSSTLFVVLVSIPIVYERFAKGAYGEERWPLAVTAYRIFEANILFGIGPSNYAFVVEQFIPASLLGQWVFTVHVEYLLRLAETGILGFLIFYSLIIAVMARLYRSTFSKRPLIFIVACGLFSSLFGSLVHRLTSIYHVPQVFLLMCTVYALSVVVGSLDKPTVPETSHQKLEHGFDSGQQ